jgi:hypothetical protein
MFSRIASKAARPAALAAAAAARQPHPRFLSSTAYLASKAAKISPGSQGRQMPDSFSRATERAPGTEATLTIRVSPPSLVG